MKKVLAVILISLFLWPVAGMAQTIGPIGENDLPKWVPTIPEIRSNMVTIFNAAIDFVAVKRANYTITKAWKEGNFVWMRVERSVLWTDVKIGEFDNIEDVYVSNGVLKVRYKIVTPRSFGWAELGVGTALGAILTIITYSIVNK